MTTDNPVFHPTLTINGIVYVPANLSQHNSVFEHAHHLAHVENKKINAIKFLREHRDMGLKQAKLFIEFMDNNQYKQWDDSQRNQAQDYVDREDEIQRLRNLVALMSGKLTKVEDFIDSYREGFE